MIHDQEDRERVKQKSKAIVTGFEQIERGNSEIHKEKRGLQQ